MKKYISTFIFGVALLSVSCVKEEDRIGKEIRFSAVSESQNGVETRTEYSNDIVTVTSGNNSEDFERINWISGDDLYIRYNSTSAIYNISPSTISGTTGNKKSTANVTPASNALEWGTGPHTFYAVYPATVPSGETAPTVNGSGVVSGFSIPATQTVVYNSAQGKYLPDMRKAYMVSYLQQSQSSDAVTLPFTPAVTALEFKLRLKANKTSQDVALVQLKSSSHVLSGSYSVNITGYANDAVTWTASPSSNFSSGTNNYITVNFKDSSNADEEPALSHSNELNFTIFVIPSTGSNGAAVVSGLSLLIKYHDGEVRELGMSGLSLVGGQKYLITNSSVPSYNGYTYYLTLKENNTVINNNDVLSITPAGHSGGNKTITIQSYKEDNNDATNVKAVPWKMQYSTDGSNWTDLPVAGKDGFTASVISGNGASLVNSVLSSESSQLTLPSTGTTQSFISSSDLDSVTPKGSVGSPYDLSYNGTSSQNTANCYIVTAPGVYKFPCVYGNSIKGGQVNTSAYWFNGSSDVVTDTHASVSTLADINTYYLNDTYPANYWAIALYNAKGNYITTNNNIITDINPTSYEAIVLWQDVPQGQEIIPYTSGYVSCDGNYVTFTIDSDRIKPGNIVIGLRGTATGLTNEFLWNWHIWIPEGSVSSSGGLMNRNLGEVTQTSVTKYADRSLRFRVIQTETGGTTSNVFVFSQEGDESNTTTTRNTYYQWGRKDPMLNTNVSSAVSVNPLYSDKRDRFFTAFQGWAFDANYIDRGRGIRAPWMLLQNSKTKVWLDGDVYAFKASRTSTTVYYIESNCHRFGPFPKAFTDDIDLYYPSFNSQGGWEVQDSNHWNVTLHGSTVQWSGTEAWYLAQYAGFTLYTDLLQVDAVNNLWSIPRNLQISQSQVTNIDNLHTNGYLSDANYNYFKTYGIAQRYLKLNAGESYPEGPHSLQAKNYLVATGVFEDTDFREESSYTYTDWVGGPTLRTLSSIVYNLWNAYLYSENPNGSPYTNKFKTIYDPCPPGYTVPTVKLASDATWNANSLESRGSLPTRNSTNDPDGYIYNINGYTYNVNGYWTDRPLMIEQISASGNAADISNYQNYDKAWMKIKGSSNTNTNEAKYRSVAASIRPMVDPK